MGRLLRRSRSTANHSQSIGQGSGCESSAGAEADMHHWMLYVIHVYLTHVRCSQVSFHCSKTKATTNTSIRRGIPFAERTGPARCRFQDTRRFCLRNS